MTNIPKARAIICDAFERRLRGDVSDDFLELTEEILTALNLMTRPTPLRRAPNQSLPMTPQIACALRTEIAKRPLTPLAILAAEFGVNGGRASEVIRGRYVEERQ